MRGEGEPGNEAKVIDAWFFDVEDDASDDFTQLFSLELWLHKSVVYLAGKIA